MKTTNFEKIFNLLPEGCAMDVIRCYTSWIKFKGKKCTTIGSFRSLEKRGLIEKNKWNKWIPTTKCFQLIGV